MPVDQLYYTSAVHGELGYPGFQVWAKSDGINAQEREELLSRINYVRPKGFPDKPNIDEIERTFPKAFRWSRLPSGRYVLTLSCYSGPELLTGNADPRGGNFFSHVLLMEDLPKGFWPIDLSEWEGWKTHLTGKEDTNRYNIPLKKADLINVRHAESFSYEELSAYLTDDPIKEKWLSSMLCCLIRIKDPAFENTIKHILIRDTHLNNPFWVACLQKAFPIQCMMKLSFSTYNFSMGDIQADIIATQDNTNLTMGQYEAEYQYYSFDYLNNTIGKAASEIQSEHDYATIIANWMANDPSKLEEFQAFLKLFNTPVIATSLDNPLRLFRIIIGEKLELKQDSLLATLNYVNSNAHRSAKSELFDILAESTISLIYSVDVDQIQIIFRFLAEAALSTGEPGHRKKVYDTWLNLFLESLAKEESMEFFTKPYEIIFTVLDDHMKEFAELAVKDVYMDMLWENLKKQSNVCQYWIFNYIVSVMRIVKGNRYWNDRSIKDIIELILEKNAINSELIKRILTPMADSSESLMFLIRAFYNIFKTNNPDEEKVKKENQNLLCIGSALHSVLLNHSSAISETLRSTLDQAKWRKVIRGDTIEGFKSISAINGKWRQMNELALRLYPKYFESHPDVAILMILQYLDAINDTSEASFLLFDIFSTGLVEGVPKAKQMIFLERFNSMLSVEEKNQKAITVAKSLNKKLGWILSPDRPSLIQMIYNSKQGKLLNKRDLNILEKHIHRLSMNEYDKILIVLSPLLLNVADGKTHGEVIRVLYRKDLRKTFLTQYVHWLLDGKKRGGRGLFCALDFWITVYPKDNQFSEFAALHEQVKKTLPKAFSKINETKARKINDFLIRRHKNDETIKRNLRSFFSAVQNNREGLFTKAKKLFGRIT